VSAAVGGAIVPFSIAAAPAAARSRAPPGSPTARRDFDQRAGTAIREAVSGTADPVDHVFDNARYRPDSNLLHSRGVRGRAQHFDGHSTIVTAQGPAASPSTCGSPRPRAPSSPRL
jgi:hypothetical protein